MLDFPDKVARQGFLNEREANFVLRRIEEDLGDSKANPLTWAKFFKHLSDLKLWAFCTLFISTTVPVYLFAYFTLVILVGMGTVVANALSVPPAALAMITAFGFAYLGDKYQLRAPIIAIQSFVYLIELMPATYVSNNGVRYSVLLGIMGGQGNVFAILTYHANNIRMQSKLSTASALQIEFAAMGGIIASTIFRQRDAPGYVVGLWVSAGLQFYTLIVHCVTSWYFWKTSKKTDGQVANGKPVGPIEGQVGFRYTI